MRWWKNKKEDQELFQKKLSEEGTEIRTNPARGWYSIYTFSVLEEIDPGELRWSLQADECMALVLISLQAYRERPLDFFALKNLQRILCFFAEHQKQVVLRPLYDLAGQGREAEPENFQLVLQHASQISHLLCETEHSVMLWQGLLIGSWGEMHDSSYLTKEHLRSLWKCIREELGDQIPVAVRTPAQWRRLIEEEKYRAHAEGLTLFDDAIGGSLTHLGTFGTQLREAAGWEASWIREEELGFEAEITRNLPFGGEVLSWQGELSYEQKNPYLDSRKVISLFRTLHLTYLNEVYDRKLLDQWERVPSGEKGIWEEKSLYEYVGAHLGYRFLVLDVQVKEKKLTRQRKLEICLGNQGFAKCMDEVEMELSIRQQKGEKEEVLPLSYKLNKLEPGKTVWVELLIPQKEGDLYLSAKRKKDGQPLFWANKGREPEVFLGHCMM